MTQQKIAVVTGSRAEYGLLMPLLRRLDEDPDIELQLVVCAAHLVQTWGETIAQIKADGFRVTETIDMLMANDSPVGITKSMGCALMGFAETWGRLQPDIVVVLGDRFEILAAATATYLARIPLAHIHGGELSAGALDDGFRHAITKLAHLHFVAATPYLQRVIQLGEEPWRVQNVGAIGLDNMDEVTLFDKSELSNKLGITWGTRNFLITYHPATLSQKANADVMQALLAACDQFADAHIIFTHSNADEGGRAIGAWIEQYVARNPSRCFSFISLGSLYYLSVMRAVDIVIGNSSSGIIEAPYYRKATVNIGPRQNGRLKTLSVIDSEPVAADIIAAITTALSAEFQTKMASMSLHYHSANAAIQIHQRLKTIDKCALLEKQFYDI